VAESDISEKTSEQESSDIAGKADESEVG